MSFTLAFRVQGVTGATGELHRARLYNPDGSINDDLVLDEDPAGSGQFGGETTVAVENTTGTQHEYEVRQVDSQSDAGYNASTTIVRSRRAYDQPGGFVVNGAWAAVETVDATVDLSEVLDAIEDLEASLIGQIESLSDELLASLAQTNQFTVVYPLTSTEMTLVQGSAYKTSQGTEITLTKQTGETGWPTSISTIDFSCAPSDQLVAENSSATSTGVDDIALSSVTSSGGVLQLSAAQTTALVKTHKSGRYEGWFVANRSTYPKVIRTVTVRIIKGDSN